MKMPSKESLEHRSKCSENEPEEPGQAGETTSALSVCLQILFSQKVSLSGPWLHLPLTLFSCPHANTVLQ